jgi:hypothetical protein
MSESNSNTNIYGENIRAHGVLSLKSLETPINGCEEQVDVM